MLSDNVYEFVNIMDEKGELVFNDRRAQRIERSMANLEIRFGQGGYQASEFIKRYLPNNYFDLLLVQAQKARGRRTLVYSIYTGKQDITTRLKAVLSDNGLKTAVLRSTVSPDKREDWIMEQVDRGIDCLICNPELVKTGMDLYDFPALLFMQSGTNVYTVQQAARRSWRIGQTEDVEVAFMGYNESQQAHCLRLMAENDNLHARLTHFSDILN